MSSLDSFNNDTDSSRQPSCAPSLTESLEPRHPPPEYRHCNPLSHSSTGTRTFYMRNRASGGVAELGLATHASDATSRSNPDAQPGDERRFVPIRGRQQPSTASSDADVDIDIAPGSSLSSMAEMSASPGFGSNLKRSLQIDMKNLVGDSVANVR